MSSEDSGYGSAVRDDFSQSVSEEGDFFDDDQEFFEADSDPTDESHESVNPAQSFDGVDEDWLGPQDEAQSAFFDTSSDEDGWNAADALKEFSAVTEALKSERPASSVPDERESKEDAAPEAPVDKQEAEAEVYKIDESNKPWLRHAHLDGAILPVAGFGDDDIYRPDATFFKTGRIIRDTPANSHGLPTLVTREGVLQRLQYNLHKAKIDRELLFSDLTGADNFVKELKADLEDAGEQIGMLKHAVDSRDDKLNKLEQDAHGWRTSSDQWMKAFESQRPLADAERERQMMIEAGIEFSQRYAQVLFYVDQANELYSVGTQTSPIEASADVAAEAERSQPTHNGSQTDAESLDIDDYFALARQRDELIEQNEKLSEEARRLKSLLNDAKGWIDDQTWTPKVTSAKQDVVDGHMESPSSSSSTNSELDSNDRILPYDWTQSSWPDRWIQREQTMRKSESWSRARDECAAQLDAWEKQSWTNAVAVHG